MPTTRAMRAEHAELAYRAGQRRGVADAQGDHPYCHDYTESADYRQGYRVGWRMVRPLPWRESARDLADAMTEADDR